MFRECDAACETDEAEQGLDGVEDGDEIGGSTDTSITGVGVAGCEDEEEQDGAIHECEAQAGEDHDWVGGTEVSRDEEVLLEGNGSEIGEVGKGGSNTAVDKFQQHQLL